LEEFRHGQDAHATIGGAMLPDAKPIPAMPLEYSTAGTEPVRPMLRAVAILLLIMGIWQVVMAATAVYTGGFFTNQWFFITRITALLAALLETLAGIANLRRQNHLGLFWMWAWAAIFEYGVGIVITTVLNFHTIFPNSHWSDSSVLLYMLSQAMNVSLRCAFPITVMIMLYYHKKIARSERDAA
jgi:hypothetical protein